jgi:hypothetical protein
MAITWLACAFNFYLLNFSVKYFPGSIFVNLASIAGAEIIG